jgi:Rps23 Pro-64 3,4-dihydroxylase Tpa1-like proline 4-hydroxylase
MTPEEHRRQKIAEELQRRAFIQSTLPTNPGTLVDFRRMLDLAHERAKEYRTGEPFPHIVIDDFLGEESFRAVYDALPTREDERILWGNLDANLADGRPAQARKFHLSNVLFMKPALRQLIAELNSGSFLLTMQQLTGIAHLLSDPHLQGGGVHSVERGGLLRVHADFNRHPTYKFRRRLNILLYMNPGWQEEYGGHLELWTKDMQTCVKRVLPVANRCVIFNTSSDSFHGHPHPLTCPEGWARKSVALYYYSPEFPGPDEPGGISTAWQELPEEKAGRNEA